MLSIALSGKAKWYRADLRLCSLGVPAQENRSTRTLSHLLDWILRAQLLGLWLIDVDALPTQQEFLDKRPSSSTWLLRRQLCVHAFLVFLKFRTV